MLLCDYCINAIRSRDEIVGVLNPFAISVDECDEYECTCEWCGEKADLSECEFVGESLYY